MTSTQNLWHHTIVPYSVRAIHGIVSFDGGLLAIDPYRGYLLRIDCHTDNTIILNPNQTDEFLGATDLEVRDGVLWFARSDSIYSCPLAWEGDTLKPLRPRRFASLGYPLHGVAVWESAVYASCERMESIIVFNRQTGADVVRFFAPGVGAATLTVQEEDLWVADTIEQTVFCLDRATGEQKHAILTPFETPTGLTFYNYEGKELLYVSYANEEPYIRDDPNAANPYQLTFRDRTFIHPLHFYYDPQQRCTLSNGYLIEMSYVEEIAPLEETILENLEWRIALPADTQRQRVKAIEPIGLPFVEEIESGQRVALFKFDRFDSKQCRIFGWKALLEVRGIKYNLSPEDTENLPELSPDFQARYLTDNDNLRMEAEVVKRAAEQAAGDETSLLRRVLAVRDYIYERLSYRVTTRIETPDVVLERGVGSCGEYVGVMLALMRLNGIACRTIGRYKCPPYPDRRNVPLEPDFNHVWLEFYVPEFGWVPVESNPDDLEDRHIKPTRFFMGLAWYHVELGKGLKFERIQTPAEPNLKERVPLGDLAVNHVRFKILEELPPPGA